MGTQVWRRRSVTGQRKPAYTDDDRLLVCWLYGRGLSQAEVAGVVGMDRSTVRYIASPTTAERSRLRHRLYRLQHRDEEIASRTLYRLEHPDEECARNKRYRQEHPAGRATANRRYRLEHPEEIRLAKRRYRREHPEQHRAEKRRYRARHRSEINAHKRARRKEMKSGNTSI